MRALASLLRIVALTAVLLIIEAASAIYIFPSESIASELGLTALLRIVTLTAVLLIIEAASAIYIFLSESIASELGLTALLRIEALITDLLTLKATERLISVSNICTVCNTLTVIKPLRRVHLRLSPRRKVR